MKISIQCFFKMKLRYKISCPADIKPDTIIKRIYKELEGPGYKITKESDNVIAFSNNIWVWRARSKAVNYLDGGTFSIASTASVNKTSVFLYFLFLWEMRSF